MPNLYATLAEVRSIAPDAITSSVTGYDQLFIRLANAISRWIDDHTQRVFFPGIETRYFNGAGCDYQFVGDLIEAHEIAYSDDHGLSYTIMAPTDYILMAGRTYDPPASFTRVQMARNGSMSYFPTGRRSLRLAGLWGYTDRRADCWLPSGDTVQNNPLSSSGTVINVASVGGPGPTGWTPRFSPGALLRIEDEFVEVTAVQSDSDTQALTVLRGRNGSAAVQHAQGTAIDLWQVPDPVRQAMIIQAVHQFKRGQAGFGDAEALPDQGRILHLKSIDPEVYDLLGRTPGEKYVALGLTS